MGRHSTCGHTSRSGLCYILWVSDRISAALHGGALQDRKVSASRPPIPALTGVRFFAASWIILFHTRMSTSLTEAGLPHAGALVKNGSSAVALFFLLSGIVLSYNYRGRLHSAASKRRFLEARFARIWPAYMLSLLAMSAVTRHFPPILPSIATIAMVQAWVPGHPEFGSAWNPVCWTLSVEALFYIVMPFLQDSIEHLGRRALLVLTVVFVVIAIVADSAGKSAHALEYGGWLNYIPLPVVDLPEFFIGALTANLLLMPTREKPLGRSTHGLLSWLGLLASIAVLSIPHVRLSFALPAFLLMLIGLQTERTLLSQFLSTRLLVFGGGISYSMYLLQMPVKAATRPLLGLIGIHSDRIGLLMVPVIIILISIPAFLWFEEPARKVLRRLFELRPAHPMA